MRTLSLLGAAAEAEGLRLRREAELFARSAAFTAGAAVMGLMALGFAHAAAWFWLSRVHEATTAALYIAGADVVVMLVLVFLGRRPKRDMVADDALRLRRTALEAAWQEAPFVGAMKLLRWRHPAYAIGGMLAQEIIRRFARR